MDETTWFRRNRAGMILAAIVFVVHSLSPSVQIGDSRLSALTAWRFVTHFDLHLQGYSVLAQLPEEFHLVSVDGDSLPYFPWPTMLLAIPGDLLLLATGRTPADLSLPNETYLVEIPTASLLVGLTAWTLRTAMTSLPRLDISPTVATIGAVVFAFGTSSWSVGSRALWQQTASMFFLSIALLCALRMDRKSNGWAWGLGLSLAMAMMTRPTNAVIATLFAVWVVATSRFSLVRSSMAFSAAISLFCAFSYTQYKTIVPPYYLAGRLQEEPAIPFIESLALNTISPSRGLIVFNPILLLAIVGIAMRIRKRAFTSLDLVLCLSVLLQWLVISKFGSTGGAAYGPRLMLDIVPFVIVLAVPTMRVLTGPAPHGSRRWPRRWAIIGVAGVLSWSVFVNATGALLRDARCWNVLPVSVDAAPTRIWDWSDPQFVRPYKDLSEGRSVSWVLRGSCAPS